MMSCTHILHTCSTLRYLLLLFWISSYHMPSTQDTRSSTGARSRARMTLRTSFSIVSALTSSNSGTKGNSSNLSKKTVQRPPRPRIPPKPIASPLILFLGSIRLNIGAFFNKSGTMTNRTRLPLMNKCSM